MKCSPWGKAVTCQAHNEQLHNLSGPLTSVSIKVTTLRSDCSFSWIIPALSMFTHILTRFALFAHIVCQRHNESCRPVNEIRLVTHSQRLSFSGTILVVLRKHQFSLKIYICFFQIALTNNSDPSRLPIRVGKHKEWKKDVCWYILAVLTGGGWGTVSCGFRVQY